MSDGTSSETKCAHVDGEIEFLGEQKCEDGMDRYYRCLKCGSVIIVSEDGFLYEVPGTKK